MLDTRFPRILGDAGNAASYPFPARIHVVPGAGAPEVVRDGLPSPELVRGFLDGARALEADGVGAIVSTCGFLVRLQGEVAAAVDVPVLLSALSLYPLLRSATGGAPIGILTASAERLGDAALRAAGIERDQVEIGGMEDCAAFAGTILAPPSVGEAGLDTEAIEVAAVELAQTLVARRPGLRAFLLECANLPPYAGAIAAATGRPVHSILDAASLLMAGVGR